MAKKTSDFLSLKKDIEAKKFASVYFLHGEETYYIDELTKALLDHVLTDEEKDFNLVQYYGADCNITDVISACRRYPMMSDRQLVMLREAQAIDARTNKLDDLELYLEHPLESTIFVITYKTKSYDSRKKLIKLCEKQGVVFESKKIRDYELPAIVEDYIRLRGLSIDSKGVQALCDTIGADMSRIASEIDKLILSLPGKKITLEQISEHIGVSKEFNSWELQTAVATRNLKKIEQIRKYFEKNPKSNPLVVTLSVLFNFFSNLMLAHYCDDKTERGLMSTIGLSYPAAKDIKSAMSIYNAWKTMYNIALIREYDAKSKGGRAVSQSDSALLKELLFKLTH